MVKQPAGRAANARVMSARMPDQALLVEVTHHGKRVVLVNEEMSLREVNRRVGDLLNASLHAEVTPRRSVVPSQSVRGRTGY